MSGHKYKLSALHTTSSLSFDDELHGEFVGVKYTHHEPVKFDGTIGEPLYLALDLRENDASGEPGRAIGFYLVGSANATSWIKEVDERIRKQKT
jgi:hypothetical protein